jgi:hypothetical protein
VNPGAEPGRDDSGLPPVDIEIPDDARELDRDVLAYRRERRALRRRARLRRALGPLRGHGAILPLIASCVAVSMVAGALLSVFSISPASAPVLTRSPVPARSAPAAPAAQLPAGTVDVNGRPTQLHALASAVLAIIPRSCNCDTALRQLTGQASRAGVSVYFVGTTSVMTDVNRLVRTDAHGAAAAVRDAGNLLGHAYQPNGLTVVLVRADRSTAVHRKLTQGFQLEDQLRTLKAAQGASSRATARSPAPATT